MCFHGCDVSETMVHAVLCPHTSLIWKEAQQRIMSRVRPKLQTASRVCLEALLCPFMEYQVYDVQGELRKLDGQLRKRLESVLRYPLQLVRLGAWPLGWLTALLGACPTCSVKEVSRCLKLVQDIILSAQRRVWHLRFDGQKGKHPTDFSFGERR